jgi:hypothetical protein
MGGGNAWQGGLGAGTSEAASGAMQSYLEQHNIPPGSREGLALLQLASVAIGAATGSGAGASTALAGQVYNEKLHPDLLKGVLANVSEFAKENGLSNEEAQNRLVLEAIRLQDSGIDLGLGTDQIGGGKGLSDDSLARGFLQKNNLYQVGGETVDIFKPMAPEDGSKNAFALYDYLSSNDSASKAYYGAMEYGLGQRGIATNEAQQGSLLAHWANKDVLMNYYASDVIKQSDNDFYKFYGQLALTGASGGLSAGVPALAAANAARPAGTTVNLVGLMLTTRAGVALTGATVNVGAQLIKNDGDMSKVNPIEVGVAGVTGALGPGGGLWWNAGVNATGGFVQTELTNAVYGKNDNVFVNTVNSAITGGIGFQFGEKVTSLSSQVLPSSLTPTVLGNVFGPVSTESSNVVVDYFMKIDEKKVDHNQ